MTPEFDDEVVFEVGVGGRAGAASLPAFCSSPQATELGGAAGGLGRGAPVKAAAVLRARVCM